MKAKIQLFYIIVFILGFCFSCGKKNEIYEQIDESEWQMMFYSKRYWPGPDSLEKAKPWKLHTQGMWYYFHNDYFHADSVIWEDLILLNKFGDVGRLPIDYLLLGLSALKQGNFEESFEYLKRAETAFKKIEHERGVAKCFYVRALNYKAQGKYKHALEALDKGLKKAEGCYKAKKHVRTKNLIITIKKEIGNILKTTEEEFLGKSHYDWYMEAINFEEMY